MENLEGGGQSETGGFEQFYGDPVASELLEKVSLEYLQTHDKDFFEREFTGELDSEGYLIRKDGEDAITKPSMNITGTGMKWVIDKVREELKNTEK